jgi:prepilin-type processing-associated H-X9-DG protein
MAIAEEGLKNSYGANVGKVLLRAYQPDIKITAKAYAAAASDARMNGCELPVVINSGSGNQGITASVPVIVYARGMHLSDEKLYRALCVSNLITIHLKKGIGALSAYCGVVSAGAGAACGVAYLLGGRKEEIAHTLVNALAIDSGIICDGAKASCAAKIATAVESGLLGLNMYYNGNEFFAARLNNIGKVNRYSSSGWWAIKPTDLRRPSGLAIVADSGVFTDLTKLEAFYFWYSANSLASTNIGIWRIHGDRANVGFWDGHVSTMSAEEMKACPMQIETTYSEYGVKKSL